MHPHRLLVRRQGGQQVSVGRRRGIGVDDGQEIVALLVAIARPHQQIVARGGSWLCARLR